MKETDVRPVPSPAVSTPSLYRNEDDDRPESSVSSPSSPLTPAEDDSRPGSTAPEPPQTDKESQTGPQRTRSTSAASSKSGDTKEKRKRSRVTPEQLVHLERYFAMDRSPTAQRRKEISDTLGMQERQTQIWFQNRRAKAKLQDGKNKGGRGTLELPPDTPPELCTGFDAGLHSLIHENEPVTIIPCTDLSIGTWKRIATMASRHDLVAYVCEARRCLTWFIQSSGYGFKMEIAFDTIVETKFANASPGTGLASFFLSQPPTFYLETVSSPDLDGSTYRGWKRCGDWTEGTQATKILRHDLVGSAVQLAHVLRNLSANAAGSEISLHPPSYRSSVDNSPQSGLLLPPINYGQPSQEMMPPTSADYYPYERPRPSFSGPPMHLNQSLRNNLGGSPPPLTASTAFSHLSSLQSAQSASLSAPAYAEYPDEIDSSKRHRYRPPHLNLSPPQDLHNMPISHTLSRRQSYADELPASGSNSHSSYSSPSPPTQTPFNAPPPFWNSSSGTITSLRPGNIIPSPTPPSFMHRLGYEPSMGPPH